MRHSLEVQGRAAAIVRKNNDKLSSFWKKRSNRDGVAPKRYLRKAKRKFYYALSEELMRMGRERFFCSNKKSLEESLRDSENFPKPHSVPKLVENLEKEECCDLEKQVVAAATAGFDQELKMMVRANAGGSLRCVLVCNISSSPKEFVGRYLERHEKPDSGAAAEENLN